MARDPKSSVSRWRRVPELVEQTGRDGFAFMTNGCPSVGGEPGCTRPMGSWRPNDAPRDYPWQPATADRSESAEDVFQDVAGAR